MCPAFHLLLPCLEKFFGSQQKVGASGLAYAHEDQMVGARNPAAGPKDLVPSQTEEACLGLGSHQVEFQKEKNHEVVSSWESGNALVQWKVVPAGAQGNLRGHYDPGASCGPLVAHASASEVLQVPGSSFHG